MTTTTSKDKATKVKTSKKVKDTSIEEPKVIKATKVKAKTTKTKELPNTKLAKKERATVQKITTTNKDSLVEKVVSQREIKYIYPEDCTDTLSRKKFRQQVRNKVRALEVKLFKMADKTSKDYRKVEKELKAFKSEYVKEDAAV